MATFTSTGSNNFNNLIAGLSSLTRRARLTGIPFSSGESNAFLDPYFAGANLLQVHHIERWVDNVELRFDVKNGVTVCELCHDLNHHETGQSFHLKVTKILKSYIDNIYIHRKIIPINRHKSRMEKKRKQYWVI